MEEREKTVPFARNIEIVEDLQGAWGHYIVAMETYWYKNGACLLITAAALEHFFFFLLC